MRGDSTKMVCKELNGWRRVMSVSEYRSFRTLGRFCAKLCTDRNDWATFCLGPAWSITNYDHKWWTINIGVLLQGALTPNGKGVHFFTARSQITYVYRVTAFVQHPSQIAHGAQSIPVKVARRLHNQQLKACECCGSPQPSAFNIYIYIYLNNITRRRVAVHQLDLRGMIVRKIWYSSLGCWCWIIRDWSWHAAVVSGCFVGRPALDVRDCLMMFWCLSDVSCHYVTPTRIAKAPAENNAYFLGNCWSRRSTVTGITT